MSMLGYNGRKIRMIFYIQVSALLVVCVIENRLFSATIMDLANFKNPSNKTERYVFFLVKNWISALKSLYLQCLHVSCLLA